MKVDNIDVFTSYNARFMTPEQVAETFVPSQNFLSLLDLDHGLIIGPRGSGKTSLLKMLQVSALRTWDHPRAEDLRQRVGFTGVFIPTDIVWKEQFSSINAIVNDPEVSEAIGDTLVTISILKALLDSIQTRLIKGNTRYGSFKSVSMSTDDQRELFSSLGKLWFINSSVPTARSLDVALGARCQEISQLIYYARLQRKTDLVAETLVSNRLLIPDGINLVAESVKLFNHICGEPGGRWALCFDEMELAPSFLMARMKRLLRSTKQELLFKVSASPYSNDPDDRDIDGSDAAEGDDFKVIPLWYAEKEMGDSFSREIVGSLLRKHQIEEDSMEVIFGSSVVGGDSTQLAEESDSSRRVSQFRELAQKDPSFRDYLRVNKLIIDRMQGMKEADRAELVRKIYPVVVHRNFFLKAQESQSRQRIAGRKSVSLYTGWQSIQAVCEGNPRMLIGIVSEMLKRLPVNSKRIPRSIQWSAIDSARHRFEAKLKAFKATSEGSDRGLMNLVRLLGERFEDDLLGRKFKGEPVGSFLVDEQSFKWLGEAVGLGLNAGAFVYVPWDKGKTLLRSIAEKRFRINYLLATRFNIPLRIGSSRTIKFLLGGKELESQLLIPLDNDGEHTEES